MKSPQPNVAREVTLAKSLWGDLSKRGLQALTQLVVKYKLSVRSGDLTYLNRGWHVTHSGLLRLAQRRRCVGIHTEPVLLACNPESSRWIFRATVYKSRTCRGFVGYGDADPSNVSLLVRGAELRVAETRAVNRALRKAYGIGICSVEEVGSIADPQHLDGESRKMPPKSANGNCGNPKVRDRLCELIRRYQLDPALVKAYATDFCGTNTLRDATREQVEKFVAHLADWAEKDRNALLCQLNSYSAQKEGAA
jgi:hypothetical protein